MIHLPAGGFGRACRRAPVACWTHGKVTSVGLLGFRMEIALANLVAMGKIRATLPSRTCLPVFFLEPCFPAPPSLLRESVGTGSRRVFSEMNTQ
jgi:hypothetical protein